jgi:putative glycosyltransferase
MYYSQDYLSEFYERTKLTMERLNLNHEFVFVDDGSPDNSLEKALSIRAKNPNVKVVELSRNFGHQKAIMTGLLYASGDYIFLIDCDLEERPECFETFWKEMCGDRSLDVVYGIQIYRKGGLFERVSGRLFYSAVNALSAVKYPADTLTSRVMTRNYVDAILSFREREIDVWGIFVLAGFKQKSVAVTKGWKGSSTFTLKKKIRRGVEVITSLSHRPLYFTFLLGMISFGIALAIIGVIVYKKLALGISVEGWASILASVWLVGGMILFVLGIFAIYLSKMFLEIKGRPLTIVKKIYS